MSEFDRILITHKPNPDADTAAIIGTVESYAKYRNIPLIDGPDDTSIDGVLIVSIGGDGTMLGAMRQSALHEVSSIVGFNTGTLGFLTEEVPTKIYEYLDNILSKKDVILESRMLLEGQVHINGNPVENLSFVAANEFVLSAAVNAPLNVEVYINDQFVSSNLGSGMIVSSSTGSTAMSLSAGGVIVSPSTKIMQIVPVLPHTLTSRPIITTGRDEISIFTELTERVPSVNIHADGRLLMDTDFLLGTDVGLAIKRGADAMIWRPKSWNFFNVLTEKMKW